VAVVAAAAALAVAYRNFLCPHYLHLPKLLAPHPPETLPPLSHSLVSAAAAAAAAAAAGGLEPLVF